MLQTLAGRINSLIPELPKHQHSSRSSPALSLTELRSFMSQKDYLCTTFIVSGKVNVLG